MIIIIIPRKNKKNLFENFQKKWQKIILDFVCLFVYLLKLTNQFPP